MAAIDEKVQALEFTTTTSKSPAQVRQLLDDAAQVAQGEKITLTGTDDLVTGVARNFVRMQHAAFTLALTAGASGSTSVQFRIPDYLRTRDMVLSFIPVSPWSAPAYKTLKQFSDYVQNGL
jgi:hypothetical protein